MTPTQTAEQREGLRIVPVTQRAAREFVAEHHRHNRPPRGSVINVGLTDGDELVGVGMAGRPVARMLQDGVTLEITRNCTTGAPNACSMIYGALLRAAKALGYRRVITYTLASEPGSSLRAVGFVQDRTVPAQSWHRETRPRPESDAPAAKRRWVWQT